MNRAVFDLPLQTYKEWVRACPDSLEWVQPQGIGEPLMYPHLIEALAYAKKRGLKTMFYTNATLLTGSMTEQLLETRLDTLTYSVDGYDERSFRTRVGASWKKVRGNIEYFQHYRNNGGYQTYTTVRATLTKLNRYHLFKFLNFWKTRVDNVAMMSLVDFPTPAQLDRTPYASGKGFQCYHMFNPGPRPLTPVLTVLNNGNVVLCCQDWFSDYVMGNLYKQKPLDAFNSPIYQRIRYGMMTGTKYPLLCEYCKLGKLRKRIRLDPYRLGFKVASRLVNTVHRFVDVIGAEQSAT